MDSTIKAHGAIISVVKFVYWEDDGAWLGYLQDYPDYWTQGETLEDLKSHLESPYADVIQLTSL